MARKTEEQHKLYQALSVVKDDAEKREEYHNHQLWCAPLHGWSQEKHNEYHKKFLEEAKQVQHYCFIRQMQIDPD